MILTCHGQLLKNQCTSKPINMNDKDIIIALPKGRILKQVLPIFDKVGIIPEKSFFNDRDRKLKFKTNIPNIKLIIVNVIIKIIYYVFHFYFPINKSTIFNIPFSSFSRQFLFIFPCISNLTT